MYPPPLPAGTARRPARARWWRYRALIGDADDHLVPLHLAGDVDDRALRRDAQRVLEDVRQHTANLAGVDLHRRQVVRQFDRDPIVGRSLLQCEPDQILDRPELSPRLRGAGLQPREVEKVADETVEAGRLQADRLDQLGAVVGRRASREGLARPLAAARIAVSGERRSCETARSTAVLTASLRRSASASSASRWSSSRSMATARSDASAGRKRVSTAVVHVAVRRGRERADRPVADRQAARSRARRPASRRRDRCERAERGGRRRRVPRCGRSRR